MDPLRVGEGDDAIDVTVTATLDGGDTRSVDTPVEVQLWGDALLGGDYQVGPLPTIIIRAGETSASATLSIAPVGDDMYEGDELIEVKLRAPGFRAIPVEFAIIDDDPYPTGVTLSAAPPSLGESDGETSLEVSATLVGSSTLGSDTTILLLPPTGTATPVDDYSAFAAPYIVIPAGSRSASWTNTLSPVDDTLDETDETLEFTGRHVEFSRQAGSLSVQDGDLTVSQTSILIIDDDETPPSIALTVDPTSVGEADAATGVTVTATLVGMSTRTVATTVDLSLIGTATSGLDYTVGDLTGVTIPAGASSGQADVTITPTNDSVVEGSESIVVEGESTEFTVTSATVTLIDNDSATVSLVGPSDAVDEGSNAEFTLTLTNPISSQISVAWATTAGTALRDDYDNNDTGIGLLPGDSSTISQMFRISIADDALSEEVESFTVALGEITGDIAGQVTVDASASSATVSIAESDPITVTLSGPSSVNEGEAASYTVSLGGVIPSADLTVDYATADGTATSDDYTAATGTLTFTSFNADDQQVEVQTAGNIIDEPNEDFTFTLSNAQGGGGPTPSLGPTTSITTTIIDDDVAPTAITLSANLVLSQRWKGRVKAMEFGSGVCGPEAPVDGDTRRVALGLVGSDLALQSVSVGVSPFETGSAQHAELDFRHVQPTGVFGRMVKLQPFHDASGFRWCKGLVQRRHAVSVQIVEDHADHWGMGIGHIHHPAHLVGEVLHSTSFRDGQVAPAGQGLAG